MVLSPGPERRHDDEYIRFLVQGLVDVLQPCIKSLTQYDPVVVGVDEPVAVVVDVRLPLSWLDNAVAEPLCAAANACFAWHGDPLSLWSFEARPLP